MIRSSVTSFNIQHISFPFALKDWHWQIGNQSSFVVYIGHSLNMLENWKFFFLVKFRWGLGEVFDALILRGDGRLRKVKHKRLPHKRKDREQTNQLLKMLNCKTATGDWLTKGRVQKMKSRVFCQTPLRLKKIPTFFWGESKTTNGWNKFDTWSHFQKK